ncbi:hypothetical protein NC653_016007 [Populus alba x Populus x berolinensis]|uniref:Uncharacterized protein n=1 Tax=Populus alba x Populus x berolinensis TaxID=444605 RepID=A0AAD6QLY0_9ROSI|nr:hypothetical protein NC653_016007 [Populus alba x Populus x berolinensis]
MSHCNSEFQQSLPRKLFKRVLKTRVEVTCFLHTKLASSKTQHYQRHVVILFCTIIMFLNSETTLFFLKREREREEKRRKCKRNTPICSRLPLLTSHTSQ